MIKTYKIGNKEVPEVPNIDGNSKYINLLLEALSDKEEECTNDCVHRYPSSKDWCDEHKQSTTLKEEILERVDFLSEHWTKGDDKIPFQFGGWREEVATDILKLIQSHLVKEIGNISFTSTNPSGEHFYEMCRQDIIKIINNL